MWILLTTKLPTEVSPPKMSIHWAGASAVDVYKDRQQKLKSANWRKALEFNKGDLEFWQSHKLLDCDDKYFDLATGFGYEPKEDGSVWIIFDNEPVKVWPHEHSKIKPENMELYLNGEEDGFSMSHFPMYGRTALYADPQSLSIQDNFDQYPRFDRTLFEAACIDGQNELQAFYTAVGGYPLDVWFALGSHYADIYGLTDRDRESKYKANEILSQIKSGWQEEEK